MYQECGELENVGLVLSLLDRKGRRKEGRVNHMYKVAKVSRIE